MNKKTGFSLSGITSILLGVVCFCLDVGRYTDFESYGGDAYTGIQQAAAQTANNVQHLAVIVKCGFGFVLIVVGLAMLVIALTADNMKKPDIATIEANVAPSETEEPKAIPQENIEELKKLKKLLDEGVISQEMFDKEKENLL